MGSLADNRHSVQGLFRAFTAPGSARRAPLAPNSAVSPDRGPRRSRCWSGGGSRSGFSRCRLLCRSRSALGDRLCLDQFDRYRIRQKPRFARLRRRQIFRQSNFHRHRLRLIASQGESHGEFFVGRHGKGAGCTAAFAKRGLCLRPRGFGFELHRDGRGRRFEKIT